MNEIKEEVILLENRGNDLHTTRHIIKNNQIQLIGDKEALNHIYYINLVLRYKDRTITFKVDLDDYNNFLKFYIWSVKKSDNGFYAMSSETVGKYERKEIRLHRLILEKHGENLTGKIVDHINRDTTDNRFSNLRTADYQLSAVNRTPRKRYKASSSKYKGVTKEVGYDKWRAATTFKGERYYLGTFNTEEEAAIAYNNKLIELLGHSDVYLNTID